MASRDIIAEIESLWEDGKFDDVVSVAEAALKDDATTADDKRELQLFVRKATTHLNRKRGIKNPPAAAAAAPAAAAPAAPAPAAAAPATATPAAAPAAAAAPEVAAPIPTTRINARYEWFQTAATVAWTVYVPGCKDGDVSVTVAAEDNDGVVTGSNDQPMSVEIAVKLPTGNNAQWSFCPLFAAVDPTSVAIKYNNRNVEITVRKVMQGFHWAGLERKGVIAAVKPTSAAAAAAAGISTPALPATVADALPQAAAALPYPNSKGRDWSRFKDEDEDEDAAAPAPDGKKLSGDEGLQKLFRKIYADADDDTKRAMMKSYQESGGTVLSTNWKEIGAKRTERKAPEGMVMKRWGKDSDDEDSAKGSSSSSSDSSSDDE